MFLATWKTPKVQYLLSLSSVLISTNTWGNIWLGKCSTTFINVRVFSHLVIWSIVNIQWLIRAAIRTQNRWKTWKITKTFFCYQYVWIPSFICVSDRFNGQSSVLIASNKLLLLVLDQLFKASMYLEKHQRHFLSHLEGLFERERTDTQQGW